MENINFQFFLQYPQYQDTRYFIFRPFSPAFCLSYLIFTLDSRPEFVDDLYVRIIPVKMKFQIKYHSWFEKIKLRRKKVR